MGKVAERYATFHYARFMLIEYVSHKLVKQRDGSFLSIATLLFRVRDNTGDRSGASGPPCRNYRGFQTEQTASEQAPAGCLQEPSSVLHGQLRARESDELLDFVEDKSRQISRRSQSRLVAHGAAGIRRRSFGREGDGGVDGVINEDRLG